MMDTIKKQIILLLAIFIPLIGFIFYGFLNHAYNEKLLKYESKEIYGVVVDIYIGTKVRDFVKYEFKVKDKVFDGHQRYYPQYENVKIGDTCRVLYVISNPEIHKLIVNDKDFIILKD